MAFRKRKKVGKGLHLNFSGSGVGLGLKLIPGLSFSLNSNGLYCNTSLPGTGFYSRNKVAGFGNNPNVTQSETEEDQPTSHLRDVELHVHCENDGTYTVKLYDEDGHLVPENAPLYYAAQKNIAFNQTIANAINDCTEELVDIYKLTAKTLTIEDMEKRVADLEPKRVLKKSYSVPEPSIDEAKSVLEQEVEKQICSIRFWQNKKKRKEYVEGKLEAQYLKMKTEWQASKSAHDLQQQIHFEEETARRQAAYDDACVALEGFAMGNVEYVSTQIDTLLEILNVPFEFSINYDYLPSLHLLRIQLDLPEIESFPQKKASILIDGNLSVKDKSKAEKACDYAKCVTGMAFFFAGMFFNVSAQILNIEISAYTQRVDPTSGHESDCYIYSVIFQRDLFAHINYDKIDPVISLQAQYNRSKILKSNEMREIKPFTMDEIERFCKNESGNED